MKKKLLAGFATGLLVTVIAASQAMATPMIGTMSATVFDVYGQEFTSSWIGQTISVSFTFDNANSEWHEYNDGGNGIAEFGKGDDSLRQTYSTSQYSMYSVMSDAEIVLPSELSALAPNYALNISNISRVGQYVTGGYAMQLFADGFNIYFTGQNNAISWVNVNNQNSLNFLYLNQFSVSTSPDTPVPEPATMLLMGTGLAGLIGSRRKKNS